MNIMIKRDIEMMKKWEDFENQFEISLKYLIYLTFLFDLIHNWYNMSDISDEEARNLFDELDKEQDQAIK